MAVEPLQFRVAGTGAFLPKRIVKSDELDNLIGRQSGWTEANFGIVKRHWAGADESSSVMGARAAQDALDDAGWDASDVDVIIGACGVMEQPIPGTAALIQRRLGLGQSGIPAFDVNATCLSFLPAFHSALTGFAAGQWRRALIVGADIASAALDFAEPESSVMFGDGAAALALEADGPHQLLNFRFATYGDQADLCQIEAGGTRLRPHEDIDEFLAKCYFKTDAPGVFRATARLFPQFLEALLDGATVKPQALDTIIPHQPSAAALEHLKRSIPNGHEKTVDVFRDHGNQIAVSMPHALHMARAAGRLAAGTKSLLIGSSAGISLGGAVVQW